MRSFRGLPLNVGPGQIGQRFRPAVGQEISPARSRAFFCSLRAFGGSLMSPPQHGRTSGSPRWRGRFMAACLLAIPSLLFGSGVAFAGPVRSLQEIRQEGVVIQKWDASCGAAALATVLTYSLQDPVSEREVASGMLHMTEPLKVKHRGGFSLLDMKHYVETRGFTGTGYREMTFNQLLAFQSPIVPILQYGNPHFIVVRGLDHYGRVNIADPGFGNRTMSVAKFESVWQGGIGFVVTR
jgi:predicted double-glycine peptidase